MRSGIIVWMIAAVFGLFVFLGSVTATCDSRLGNIVKKISKYLYFWPVMR